MEEIIQSVNFGVGGFDRRESGILDDVDRAHAQHQDRLAMGLDTN